jgi:hypothetical protein
MEQRKFQRFSDNSLVTFSGETAEGEGRLDNLSLGGAAVLSDVAIPRGEYLTLTITFPTQAGAIEIELAPVRWVKDGSFGWNLSASRQDHNSDLSSTSRC